MASSGSVLLSTPVAVENTRSNTEGYARRFSSSHTMGNMVKSSPTPVYIYFLLLKLLRMIGSCNPCINDVHELGLQRSTTNQKPVTVWLLACNYHSVPVGSCMAKRERTELFAIGGSGAASIDDAGVLPNGRGHSKSEIPSRISVDFLNLCGGSLQPEFNSRPAKPIT